MPEATRVAAFDAPAQRTLAVAAKILKKADIEETVLLRKRRMVDLVVGVSICVSVTALLMLALGWVDGERLLAFTTFVMLSSAGVAVVAAMVSRVIAWSAFVKERVDRLTAEMEADEQAARMAAYVEKLESAEERRRICALVVPNLQEPESEICIQTLTFAAAEARREFHYEPKPPRQVVASGGV